MKGGEGRFPHCERDEGVSCASWEQVDLTRKDRRCRLEGVTPRVVSSSYARLNAHWFFFFFSRYHLCAASSRAHPDRTNHLHPALLLSHLSMSLVPRLPSAGHTAASILSRASSLVPRSAFSAICESASAATATGTAGRGIPSFTASSFVSPGTSAVPPASSSLQSAWSPATSAAPGTSAILTAISHLQSSQSSPSASAETQSVAETKDQGPFTDEE